MGPYDITQVDVPGLLGAYQSGRAQRFQQMAAQRQIAREDAEAERQHQIRTTLAKIYAPQAKGGDPASSGTAPAQAGAVQQGPPSSLIDPAQLPPRTDGVQINHDALRDLYSLDPETAKQVQDSIYTADKRQLEQVAQHGDTLAKTAYYLKGIPQASRAAELQALTPQLVQMGLSPEEIAKADLSDQGLDRYLVMGQKLTDVISQREPKFLTVPYQADIVNVRDPAAVAEFNARGAKPRAAPPGVTFTPMDEGGPTSAASGDFPGN